MLKLKRLKLTELIDKNTVTDRNTPTHIDKFAFDDETQGTLGVATAADIKGACYDQRNSVSSALSARGELIAQARPPRAALLMSQF